MRRHREADLIELQQIFLHYSGLDPEEPGKIDQVKMDVKLGLKRALRRAGLGHSTEFVDNFIATSNCTSLTFDGFVDLATEIRAVARERMRQNAGFTAKEVTEYKTKFQVYDADGTGDIAGLELRHLLEDIFPDSARNVDQRTRIEKILKEVDQDGSGSLDFADFLRLMRHYADDCENEELKNANEKFTEEEAQQFKEIFNAEASVYAETNKLKDKAGGQDGRITIAQVQAMVIKVCPLTTTEIEALGNIIRECQNDSSMRTVDYLEFLRIMRHLIDQNLGNILGVTAQRVNANSEAATEYIGTAFTDVAVA